MGKIFRSTASCIIFLIFFWPIGLYIMWKHMQWKVGVKRTVTGVVLAFAVLSIYIVATAPPSITLTSKLNTDGGNYSLTADVYPTDAVVTLNDKQVTVGSDGKLSAPLTLKEGDNSVTIVATKGDKVTTRVVTIHRATAIELEAKAKPQASPDTQTQKPTSTPTPTQTKTAAQATPPATPAVTVSQKNALSKAKDYLGYTAFSHDGLVKQLEYEQFSTADAVYGADNSGADWNAQAAKKAKDYMDYSSFSRGSLITQLEYDKFTPAQAAYGATSVGL